ncbi:hypothetical protein [Paraburkholderia sp. SIMBA_054]|uniref:hypothetical protein n=1 Tax=Paraburkholderia sp. SIMBA_054 TaxID=3085795 RepID=UPI00397B7424
MQQLDIFADSRDVMLRNAVLEELQRRDGDGARTALDQLATEFGVVVLSVQNLAL